MGGHGGGSLDFIPPGERLVDPPQAGECGSALALKRAYRGAGIVLGHRPHLHG